MSSNHRSEPFLYLVASHRRHRHHLEENSAIVHMRETTVKHGRLTRRRWYGTKMRLHSVFEQQKGSELVFSRFWGHSRLWPQNLKKASPDTFRENMIRKVYTAKISGPYQLFYGSGPIFFFSVNAALGSLSLNKPGDRQIVHKNTN